MRANINCEYQNKTKSENIFICKIGLYGGHPYIGNCIECIKNNHNNKNYSNELLLKYERSHPSSSNKISGCCDSAKNYT